MSSLPLLQSQIRRDPAGYEEEYRIQFRSFEATAQTFHVTPGRLHKNFQELVSFIAHVYPCYPDLREELNFPQIVFSTLRREPDRIHPSARKVLVASILSLLRREAVGLSKVLQELFKLFAIEDKELRALMHGRLLSEISGRTSSVGGSNKNKKKSSSGSRAAKAVAEHVPPAELKKRVQDFFMKIINNGKSTSELELRAVASLVCALYKRKDWVDDFTVNSMLGTLCRSTDTKVSSAAMYMFLGESSFAAAMLDSPMMMATTSSSSKKGEEEDDIDVVTMGAGGKSKQKKQGSSSVKKGEGDSVGDFSAIDGLIEPYSFTEDVLKRAMNNTDRTSFEYRLLALRVVCLMVYRRELVLPNLYPFLEKYLYPSNRHVTKVLACLAQASHGNVPPEELESVVRHVLNQFVSDHCRPEVMTVGLNALRGICERAPLALSRDQLMDLVQYRHMKTSKSVSCAARALLNLYRDVHPELLHRTLRGREAAIAVQKGTNAKVKQFGDSSAHVVDDIQGLDLLVAAKKKRKREEDQQVEEDDEEGEDGDEEEDDDDDDEGGSEDDDEEGEDDYDEEEEDNDEEGEDDEVSGDESEEEEGPIVKKVSVASEEVLGNADFRRIKKLRTIVAQDGSLDSDVLDDEEDEEDEEGEDDQDWILNPNKLGSLTGKKFEDSKRRAAEERKEAFLKQKDSRKGGLTNKEKKRMKPLMMSVQKEAKRKRGMSASQKFKQARTHLSNLKKQIGPQKRRRSGKSSRR